MRVLRSISIAACLVCAFFFAPAHALPQTDLHTVEVPLKDLVKPEDMEAMSKFYKKNHTMSWSIFVPKKYDPENPPGVLVYISPTVSGRPPASWLPVLERENMIYISTNKAGNFVAARQRISNVVFALAYVQSHYKTDEKTTILSGFSGGGRMTSTIIEIMPNLFTGAIFIGGAYDWKGSKTKMEDTLRDRSYVFITGKKDHARYETRRTYRTFRDLGVANVKIIDLPDLSHELPEARELSDTLEFIKMPKN